MSIFSRFENKMEDAFDDLGDKLFDAPISPVQIAKKSEKQMRRNKMVGAGKQYAPTLYTVLVNASDDSRLFGYYPTLAGETETYLKAKANEFGLVMDGDPLVRFIVDKDLKHGKFDVIAEAVSGDIISQLRDEEMERYGIKDQYSSHSPKESQSNQNISNDFRSSEQYQDNFQNNSFEDKSEDFNYSSSFADSGNSVRHQEMPMQSFNDGQIPAPQPAPQPAPVQNPQPAPQPVPVPQAVPAISDLNVNNQAVQNSVSSNSPTAVFAGGFDVSGNRGNNANSAVPIAHLRDINTGKLYTLNAATIIIGRESTCNIVLNDVNTSRQHAQITFNQGLWLVNDLGSTNGTFINNQEITTREIHSGDVLTIGVTKLTFSVG